VADAVGDAVAVGVGVGEGVGVAVAVPVGVAVAVGVADAVGVTQLRVSLSPERIPGFFVAVEAGADHPGVDRVDFGRALTLQGQAELVARLADPVGTELPDLVFGVQHQPKPVREGYVDVPLVGRVGGVEAE